MRTPSAFSHRPARRPGFTLIELLVVIAIIAMNGKDYPATSPHVKGNLPMGGSVGYKDGHAVWHKFDDRINPMALRSDVGLSFWW